MYQTFMSRVGQVRRIKRLRFLKIIYVTCLQAEILVKMDKLHDASRIVSWILEQKPFNVKAAQHLANIYGLSQQHTQVSNHLHIFWNRCNILIPPHFPVHIRVYTNEIPMCMCPWGCTVHHSACTVQPRGYTGMRQVFTIAHAGIVKYCANQNATPVL